MIAWLHRVLDGTPRPPTPDATEARHNATLIRADRLLRLVDEYRAAEKLRRK